MFLKERYFIFGCALFLQRRPKVLTISPDGNSLAFGSDKMYLWSHKSQKVKLTSLAPLFPLVSIVGACIEAPLWGIRWCFWDAWGVTNFLTTCCICMEMPFMTWFNRSLPLWTPPLGYKCIRGSRDGAVVTALVSHQCGPGSRTRRHMWVEFVVGSLLCSENFFSPDTLVFPSPLPPI